jgi:outer membrane protein assembly factor BamB
MKEEEKIIWARQSAIIAGVFTLLVSLLLILNYVQIKSGDPLESQALKLLTERFSAEPGNQQLVEEIRQLDLMVRRAYFNSLWQIRTGAYLLLFGGMAMIISLRLYYRFGLSIEKPGDIRIKDKQIRSRSQMWIGSAALLVILLAGYSAFFSADHLKSFQPDSEGRAKYAEEGIERIEITGISRETPKENQTVPGEVLPVTEEEPADTSSEEKPPVSEAEITPDKPEKAELTAASVWQNHNAFRGAWGNGISRRTNIPTQWDGESNKNILWKQAIPLHGYNSPVLWGDKLFLSGANDSQRVIYCLNRNSGEILWQKNADNIPGSPATPPKTTDDTGLAAPTLAVNDQSVFAIFGTGDIIAFDHQGNRKWARNLGVPANHYGHSSSLLTWEEKVFVQYDTQSGSRVLALDVLTGKTIWETPRSSGVSWASPILTEVNGTWQLVLAANPNVAAYDIDTGKEIWSVNCLSGEVGPSPAYGGGLIFAANEYARMVAINPNNGEIVWEDNYYLPEVASPVYHEGLLYIATSYAVFACFDAKTGEFLWEYDTEDGFYSSPVVVDGKIYIFDMEGQAYIFRPGREPHLIDSPQLGEKVFATPVFANSRIYIRGNKHIYCIGE